VVASNHTAGYAFNFQYQEGREATDYAGEADAHRFLRNDSVFHLVNKQLRVLRVKQDSVMQRLLHQMASRQMWVANNVLTGDPRACMGALPSGRTAVMATKKRKEPTTFSDFYANLDTVESIKTSFKENFDKVEKKAEVMQDVFNALVTGERKIDKRINARMLDSLLKKEIHNRGIDIPFEYGVHAQDNNGILFASLPGSSNRLLASPFKVSLFPNDLNCEGNYLMVNCPGQKHYIFQKLGVVFLSSAVLIMVIISCFYVAITTILKQKKLSEIKNDFISNMTHEFKTPIATISLACEVLQEAAVTEDPIKRTRYLNVIHDENKRLGLQVEKVLQSAILDKGNLRLKISPVDIHEVIDQALQNIGVQIEQRQGEIRLELNAEKTVVEADEMHLTNIVHNLLDNANKYSPEEPRISIQTRSVREGVYLTITDKGIGMTKDALQRIFERFYRVPTGNVHNVKGFGLGLSYVKTILQMHQGHIRVESQPNKGSSFEIYLPYAQG
jgi:two-component system phosphate regulon sensor histidine kinase PhoR